MPGMDDVTAAELTWTREWPARTSILVLAFSGYFDASSAATAAVDHLIAHSAATPIAHIDGERFFDMQQNRPHVELVDGTTRRVVWPETTLYANDEVSDGRELVLLSGVEPHYAWRDYADLLIAVAEHTAAQVVVTLGATPGQTPHTRAPLVHSSSANPMLADRLGLHRPRYQGITGIVGVLQSELDARSRPAISMQVGVPHYAAGATDWKAAMALLRELEDVTGIPTGHADLAPRAREWQEMVDRAIADSAEAGAYVPQLEAMYDLRTSEDLPSSEDIAAEFERYLRELPEDPGPAS